jgi:predicted nucleotidyltransferase
LNRKALPLAEGLFYYLDENGLKFYTASMSPTDIVATSHVEQIVSIIHPLKVVLFGSTVRDEASSDSDIDLLVIVPEGSRRRAVAQKLYQEIRNAHGARNC